MKKTSKKYKCQCLRPMTLHTPAHCWYCGGSVSQELEEQHSVGAAPVALSRGDVMAKKVTAQEVHAEFAQAIEQTPGLEESFTLKPWDEMSEDEQANMAEMAWKLNLVASEMEIE